MSAGKQCLAWVLVLGVGAVCLCLCLIGIGIHCSTTQAGGLACIFGPADNVKILQEDDQWLERGVKLFEESGDKLLDQMEKEEDALEKEKNRTAAGEEFGYRGRASKIAHHGARMAALGKRMREHGIRVLEHGSVRYRAEYGAEEKEREDGTFLHWDEGPGKYVYSWQCTKRRGCKDKTPPPVDNKAWYCWWPFC